MIPTSKKRSPLHLNGVALTAATLLVLAAVANSVPSAEAASVSPFVWRSNSLLRPFSLFDRVLVSSPFQHHAYSPASRFCSRSPPAPSAHAQGYASTPTARLFRQVDRDQTVMVLRMAGVMPESLELTIDENQLTVSGVRNLGPDAELSSSGSGGNTEQTEGDAQNKLEITDVEIADQEEVNADDLHDSSSSSTDTTTEVSIPQAKGDEISQTPHITNEMEKLPAEVQRFAFTYALDDQVNSEGIRAEIKDGVLRVLLPDQQKPPKQPSKKIPLSVW
jgi:HSP20 family molecular chaperone IbpA